MRNQNLSSPSKLIKNPVLYLRGGPLPETTRNLQDLEDDALSDATEAAAADEIELEEVNLLNNQIDDFNDQGMWLWTSLR